MDREAHEPPHRKLVSVRCVSLIKPLYSSQTHEVIMIDGWPVVGLKDRFAVNQKVLYFAIDCVLPLQDKRYEPYRFSHFLVELHGQKGWTVQTVKHGMHISQGMVFAMRDFSPEISLVREKLKQDDWSVDNAEKELMRLDLKEYFKIRKWSTFYPRDGGVILGRSPSLLPASKSERVQNIPELWATHGDTEFQITEILDGIPIFFYHVWDDPGGRSDLLPGVIMSDDKSTGMRRRPIFGVSSGGYDYQDTRDSISWNALRQHGILDDILGGDDGLSLAGVLCGQDILGNPHMIQGRRLYTYAMCDSKFKTWKTTDDHDGKWDADLLNSLDLVPKFATRVRLSAFAKDLNELMQRAQGASCVSPATRKEYPSLKRKGLAFRTLDGSFSFKVIANDWLLDETEKLRKAGQDNIVSRPGPDDCV